MQYLPYIYSKFNYDIQVEENLHNLKHNKMEHILWQYGN